jgi:hypothetical protein
VRPERKPLNNLNFAQNDKRSKSQSEPNSKDCRQEREYLAALEGIARHGRTSNDPAEVAAAIRCFARPSTVLRRLAERSRSCI